MTVCGDSDQGWPGMAQADCREPSLDNELVTLSDFGFQALCYKGKSLAVDLEGKAVNCASHPSQFLLVCQARLKTVLSQQFAKRKAEFTKPRVPSAIQDLPHVFRDGHYSRALHHVFVQGGSPISVSIRLM